MSDLEGHFPFQPVEEVPRLLGHLSGLVRNQKLLNSLHRSTTLGGCPSWAPLRAETATEVWMEPESRKGLDTGHAESEFADAVGCMVVWSQLGLLPGLLRSAVKCVYFIVH